MISIMLGAATMNSFVTLSVIRTAARRQVRRARVASDDAAFVAKAQAAIPDIRKVDGDAD